MCEKKNAEKQYLICFHFCAWWYAKALKQTNKQKILREQQNKPLRKQEPLNKWLVFPTLSKKGYAWWADFFLSYK